MRFYRVSISVNGGNSGGFYWYTTRREAEARKRGDDRDNRDEVGEAPADIDVIDVTPTKAGILDALRRFASYPDNG